MLYHAALMTATEQQEYADIMADLANAKERRLKLMNRLKVRAWRAKRMI